MRLDTEDDQLMALAAFRYCLGRQSYIVGACIDWLRDTWPQMTPNTRHCILRDTVTALVDGLAGSNVIDAPGWRQAVHWMFATLTPEQADTLRRAVAYRGVEALRLLSQSKERA